MTNLLSAFNNHFIEFVEDIQSVFPDDADVLTAKNALVAIRKANPKLIVKIWQSCITQKYRAEIEAGNLQFFLDKDYADDVSDTQHSDRIMESINRLREPIRHMGPDNQQKAMKYIQNLTKLSLLCGE